MSKIILNSKYKPLFTTNDRFIIATGGRGSGKSFSITSWILLLMLAEEGHTILFTRYTMTSAHLSIIPEFLEKIELLGKENEFDITKDSIENKTTGSKILFKGIRTSSGDQTAALKSLNGVTTWVLDEAEELMSEKIFDKINLSIRAKNKQNRVILILNPATKNHWIYKRFFLDNEVEPGSNTSKNNVTYIHTTYLDNIKNLNESFVTEIELLKDSNPEKYETTIMGGWMNRHDGVVFKDWGQIANVPPEAEIVGYGMDFGTTHPTTLVGVYKYDGKIILDEMLYQSNMKPSLIAETVRDMKLDNSVYVFADSAYPGYIRELKDKDVSIYATPKPPGSVNQGIALMLDYDILITKRSTNLMNEFNNYTWQETADGSTIDNPIKKWDDAIDAARYVFLMRLKYKNASTMITL